MPQEHSATETPLVARPLEKDAVERAYPLVRNLAPSITLERWVRFARLHIDGHSAQWPRGLVTIENAAGYILGLFGFEVRNDLVESRTLRITNIIIPNIPGRDWVWESAFAAIEGLAKENGCRAIRAEVGDELDPSDTERGWVVAALGTSGYALDGVGAFKRLGKSGAIPSA